VVVAGGGKRLHLRALGAALVLIAGGAACGKHVPPRPVSDAEARTALGVMASLAAQRTPAAMQQLCDMSLDDCAGMSGGIQYAPDGAPGPGRPPKILCSRAVGDGAWMLVVDGRDGLGRPYTSQVVFGRDGNRVVPVREPAYWLGISYGSNQVVGSTSWSSAYGISGNTDRAFTATILAQARAACE
jgi:hypothetical protein